MGHIYSEAVFRESLQELPAPAGKAGGIVHGVAVSDAISPCMSQSDDADSPRVYFGQVGIEKRVRVFDQPQDSGISPAVHAGFKVTDRPDRVQAGQVIFCESKKSFEKG
jgi:hypothetical protein